MNQGNPTWGPVLPQLPFDIDLRSERPCDPYLVWAGLRGTLKAYEQLPFLLELKEKWCDDPLNEDAVAILTKQCPVTKQCADLSAWVTGSCYQTVWLCACKDCQSILVVLHEREWIKRFQLGAARGTSQIDSLCHSPPAPHPHLPAVVLKTLGVIDDGCCIAHASFRNGSETRFAVVWDQDPRAKPTSIWQRYKDVKYPRPGYGVELTADTINLLLKDKEYCDLGEAAERKFYKKIERPNWGGPDRTHGARVLHLFAAERQLHPAPPPPSDGSVTKMPIIFVQLPEETVEDTSGGSLGFHVLEGARYIVNRAQRLANPDGDSAPVAGWETTINISLGSIAGPHDGTTIAERALDELIDEQSKKKNKVRIVVAAGNTARSALHAFRDVEGCPSKQFRIMVQPDNFRESFVEFWLPLSRENEEEDARCWFSVTTPDGVMCSSLRRGEVSVLTRGTQIIASAIFARAVAQGEKGTMVLLAIAPTARLDGKTNDTAPYGVWTVAVESTCSKSMPVHAWVERNSTIIGAHRSQRTRFVPDCPPGSKDDYVRDDYTLGGLSNGKSTECVGAYEIGALRVTPYSSWGPVLPGPPEVPPTKPSIFGPSDFTRSLPGIGVPGFFTGTRSRLSGTSAAAARVARWIAEGAKPDEKIEVHSVDDCEGHPSLQGVKQIKEINTAVAPSSS